MENKCHAFNQSGLRSHQRCHHNAKNGLYCGIHHNYANIKLKINYKMESVLIINNSDFTSKSFKRIKDLNIYSKARVWNNGVLDIKLTLININNAIHTRIDNVNNEIQKAIDLANNAPLNADYRAILRNLRNKLYARKNKLYLLPITKEDLGEKEVIAKLKYYINLKLVPVAKVLPISQPIIINNIETITEKEHKVICCKEIGTYRHIVPETIDFLTNLVNKGNCNDLTLTLLCHESDKWAQQLTPQQYEIFERNQELEEMVEKHKFKNKVQRKVILEELKQSKDDIAKDSILMNVVMVLDLIAKVNAARNK